MAPSPIPSACSSITTKRLIRPPTAASETWFIYHLGRRLKAKAALASNSRNAPLNALTWDYRTHGKHAEPDVDQVLREINGWTWKDGKQLKSYNDLKKDGSTASGCWIYCGVYPDDETNRATQREPKDYLGRGWGFAWPNDGSRVIYNRASARPDGQPWSDRKKLVWWDEQQKTWTGLDRPDFVLDKRPDDPGDLQNGHGTDGIPVQEHAG